MTVMQEADELTAKENRFLKQTILALRQELEEADAVRQDAVQVAISDALLEIDQLKATSAELREDLERNQIQFEEE